MSWLTENVVLIGALTANLGIAIAKFVAAGITGSSSMLSEGFHSVVDSMNQVLMLLGEHRATRPPDKRRPFGYGRELYFWAFLVAILIFSLGSGLSLYEGYIHITNPEELGDPTIAYIVLGVAMLLEGTSWTIAMREFSRQRGDRGFWEAIRHSKDPSVFIVLFEDSAALSGLVVAALGIWSSRYFNEPRLDGAASLVIGAILATVAIFLARETKGLLIGEPASPELIARIRETVGKRDWVTGVNHIRTIHTSPSQVFTAISADFADDLSMGDAESLVEDLERELKEALPEITSIYIRPEKAADAKTLPEQKNE
ncbi:cation diffusion facilitator family transporter [Aurantiacibacter spongiae]|uniref:Cation transporter n=1 Tax=Aurantiacibacter spongiae TaxID=2488860 RepID=A0A3N5CWZ9_9SPHN|nr:cation diffusion facilitator family transporter [Aurantiacibacter spongiae]RPF72100.1 cation transporter [Aurantiacibacter spongiae]